MLPNISTRVRQPGIPIVQIDGRITPGRACTYREDSAPKAIAKASPAIMPDRSAVRRIDRSGDGIIALKFGKMSRAGGRSSVAVATGARQMTQRDSVFPFSPSVEQAWAALAAEHSVAVAK